MRYKTCAHGVVLRHRCIDCELGWLLDALEHARRQVLRCEADIVALTDEKNRKVDA